MNLLHQYFSISTFVIYFGFYNDDKNICDNINRERENIKFIGLVGPMGKMGCLSTFMVHLGQDMHFQYWGRNANYV